MEVLAPVDRASAETAFEYLQRCDTRERFRRFLDGTMTTRDQQELQGVFTFDEHVERFRRRRLD